VRIQSNNGETQMKDDPFDIDEPAVIAFSGGAHVEVHDAPDS
jgi:hypothetical protein